MMSEEVETSGEVPFWPHLYWAGANEVLYLRYTGSPATSGMESSVEASSPPVTEEPKSTGEEEVQLEPTKSEMERERLIARAEQVRWQR